MHKRLPCDYVADLLPCPVFDAFLDQITGGDNTLIIRIYQMIGYIVSPKTDMKVFFVLQGVPNSGKSVLANFLESLFERQMVINLGIEEYEDKSLLSELDGKLLCVTPDITQGVLSDAVVGKVKILTGNDTVSKQQKFCSNIRFDNRITLVFVSNFSISSKVEDEGFLNRAVTIPFKFSIAKEQQDRNLLSKLEKEKSAVVSKAVNYFHLMEEQGEDFAGTYHLNEVVSKSKEMDSDDSSEDDLVYQFVKKAFVIDKEGKVFFEDAYSFFNRRCRSVPKETFSKLLKKYMKEIYGIEHCRDKKVSGGNSTSCYRGVRLEGEAKNE